MTTPKSMTTCFASALTRISTGLGLVVLGFLLSHSITRFKAADRYVSVRGLAEREVEADLVIWPIGYKEAAPDLSTLYEKFRQKNDVIVKFLKDRGFEGDEIITPSPTIFDAQAEAYQNQGGPRYKGTSVITLRTTKIKPVLKAMQETSLLVKNGIALSQEDWNNKTNFVFTKLNDIKPAMIEEATKNGREAAEKFAKDSGSEIGQIRQATQGLFTVEQFDQSSPQLKKVRVVTTIDFFIE